MPQANSTTAVGDLWAQPSMVATSLLQTAEATIADVRMAYKKSGGWLVSHDVGREEPEVEKDELRRRRLNSVHWPE